MSDSTIPAYLSKAYNLTPPVSFFTLPAAGVNNSTVGVRTGTGDYVWKTYQTFTDPEIIRQEHRLLGWLDAQSRTFAVPAPVFTRAGDTLVATPKGYAALFPLLPGQRPDHTNPQQIEAVGATLGELHATLLHYPEPYARLPQYSMFERIHPLVTEPDRLPQQPGLCETEAEAELCAWWRDEIAHLQRFVTESYAALPHQVIHGDFAPSNTLYEAGITAILDFEMALWDARAIDVAAGLTWSMRIWENEDPLTMGASFCRGYVQWIHLTDDEIRSISWLMRLVNAVSVIWWLGRDLAEKREPCLQRMERARAFTRWLDAHETQFAVMLWQSY